MKRISLSLAPILALIFSQGVVAQTISQPVDNPAALGNAAAGQSFVATVNGNVTAIGVRPATTPGVRTLHFYAGGLGSGTVGAVGTPLYSQPGVALTTVASGGPMQIITLTTPFPVTAGQPYSFVFDGGATQLRMSTANPYAGGTRLIDYATPQAANDLAFEIFEALPAIAPGVTAVPTLSQWGLGALVLLLAVSGILLRRNTSLR